MSRAYTVVLHGRSVGQLSESTDGRIVFRFSEAYGELESRPVLSQSFEDDLQKTYPGKRTGLPAFFANLVPEGQMRSIVHHSLGIPDGDDLGLLAAAAQDLPGALELVPAFEPVAAPGATDTVDDVEGADSELEENVLRFSLAGVQMKFSVLRSGEKLMLTGHNAAGDWIVKLDSHRFPQLTENEYSTLEWARAAGFEVPECYLQPIASLDTSLRSYAPDGSRVFVIRRYDRGPEGRVHQEDFAQAVGLQPSHKYEQLTYEQCAALVRAVAGPSEYFEFVRRLAFMVASGNVDAHLKNWSFLYRDRVTATLAPMYDQVSTVAWPELKYRLALKFSGNKDLLHVDEKSFARLAERAGGEVKLTVEVALDALNRTAEAWTHCVAPQTMPPIHIDALRRYWKRSPLLQRWADQL